MSRAIDRDRNPITGLAKHAASPVGSGNAAAAAQDFQERRAATRERDCRNPILGEGNLGTEVKLSRQSHRKDAVFHSPLNLNGGAGAAADFPEDLRPNGRPGKGRIEQANRNIIAGSGNFGVEWDPIYGYAGRRHRQLPAVELLADEQPPSRSNPLTGVGVSSYEINQELKKTHSGKRTESDAGSNPLTGENCSSYTISEKLNERRHKSDNGRNSGGNPLTGENCITSDTGPLVGCDQASRLTGVSNPVTGVNCATYSYNSAEFRQKLPAVISTDAVRNPLTGKNCPGFAVNVEEKHRQTQPMGRCNPVTGEGCQQFTLCLGEKQRLSLRSPSSPTGAAGNPLTGENVGSFDVHREQRGGQSRRC